MTKFFFLNFFLVLGSVNDEQCAPYQTKFQIEFLRTIFSPYAYSYSLNPLARGWVGQKASSQYATGCNSQHSSRCLTLPRNAPTMPPHISNWTNFFASALEKLSLSALSGGMEVCLI